MKVECTFSDYVYSLGVNQRVKKTIEIKNVGKNRIERTVLAQAKKLYPMMAVHSFEVVL
jgi:hypothetical protein